MQAELERLLVLQDRDQKIRKIRAEIDVLPEQKRNLETQLAASVSSLEAAKLRAKEVEVQRKNLELDVGTRQGSIARLKTQQYETRKNDEFQAMGHEIERYEKEIQKIEDQELELMEQYDKLKAEIAAEEKVSASAKASVATQMSDLDEKGATLKARLDALAKEREELVGGIDEDVIERYERLFASKGDAAIVAVEHGVCTGCHMKVTTQTAVRARSENEIVSCEQCGRILFSTP